MSAHPCKECRSWAINPHLYGREPGVDLDLCDVCYWRKRAEARSLAGHGEATPVAREQRRVVCAAIRAAGGEVLLGIRHYSKDMHRQIEARRDGEKFTHRHDEDQGFVDQWGVYMDRYEAYSVALAAGQVKFPEACGNGLNGPKLYSEGLY